MGVETRKRLVWACTMRPSPCRFRFIRLYRALRMGADDAPPAADRHAAGFPPAALLKSVLFGSAGGRKSPFPPERRPFGAALRYFVPAVRSILSLAASRPRREPHPSCGLREQCLHPQSTAARRTGVGALPQRREPAARTKRRARARQAEAVRSLWQHTPMSYGAGTRALTSCRATPASA